ncbi:MAG TPA: Gfo/Idh/MocA family oxidoreductase [Geminicoccus sp.]|uniref:Gfo/Idh/MocA family protein n=1 Tax=Geminicoccus sp. TaxID=2024832 RepID=UPI002E367FEE|nr:Gfo/Idh/MocA family oxidoreductase [Geminicoccus sp.]HEX2529745.1 Gfo/Idh/MocA family oxidoreductase [Geminicoccus sp.]
MNRLNIGLIGSGFMGRSHALAWRASGSTSPLDVTPHLELLADVDAATAGKAAAGFGFARSTGDWEALVADPAVDLVDVTTPNILHAPMCRAVIAAGKPLYCEKPLAPDARTAFALAREAEAAGVPTFVGFNYLRNPLTELAREIVQSGEIGEVWNFRGIHAEDYMTDPKSLWTWRLDPKGGAGAVADLGSHIISLARYVVGPIERLCADVDTVVAERPTREGGRRPVEVDDQARALVRFANGAKGTIEASWVATGRKMYLAFELVGSKGSICLNMERMNELKLYVTGRSPVTDGWIEIPSTPAHKDYAGFIPAPGHQLGFNDIKTIEVAEIVRTLTGAAGQRVPDFREAAEIQATVDAILLSAKSGGWVSVDGVAKDAGR